MNSNSPLLVDHYPNTYLGVNRQRGRAMQITTKLSRQYRNLPNLGI